ENHLADAIARIYALYAERLPAGPERTRAAAMADTIAAMESPPDPVGRAAVFAPDIELVDHRITGTWSARGTEAARRHFESVYEVADDLSRRDHDVLALEPNALLVVRSRSGTGKFGIGPYERRFVILLAAGEDGRLGRIEWFDVDRITEALARFDELMGP